MKHLFLVKTGEWAIDIAEMMIGGFPAQFLSRESCAEVQAWLEIPLALSFLACDGIGAIWTPMLRRAARIPLAYRHSARFHRQSGHSDCHRVAVPRYRNQPRRVYGLSLQEPERIQPIIGYRVLRLVEVDAFGTRRT